MGNPAPPSDSGLKYTSGNPKISAENFSQLYASLETLEVKHIVSTLLEIDTIRKEIQKRVIPRKRSFLKLRDQMKSNQHITNLSRSSESFRTGLSKASFKALSMIKRKSRKSLPAKLNSTLPRNLASPNLTSAVSMSTRSAFTPISDPTNLNSEQTATPTRVQPTTVADNSQPNSIYDSFLPMNPLSCGIPAGLMNPAIAYWNWCRLATSQLPNQYSRFGLHKPLSVHPKNSNLLMSGSYEPPWDILKSEVKAKEESYSSSEESNISANDRTESRAEKSSSQNSTGSSCSTLIKCPDCKESMPLILLYDHMKNDCCKESAQINKLSVEPLNLSSDEKWGIKRSPEAIGEVQHSMIKNRTFACDLCDQSFKNKSSLKRHKITHTEGGGFSCSFCKKVFAKPELLKRHEIIHNEISRNLWPCPTCGKGFSNKYNLAVHVRIHTGEMPFQCPECNEKFRVKCSMQNHMKSKHPELVFQFDSESTEQSPAPSTHSD